MNVDKTKIMGFVIDFTHAVFCKHIVLDPKRVETCVRVSIKATVELFIWKNCTNIKASLGQVGSDKLETEQCSRRYTVLFCSLA